MKRLLTILAVVMACDGLWTHDWRIIIAGASVAAIWPLISADIETASRDELLDALWDDGEIEERYA